MPAEVLDDPLGISCVFSDGRRVTVTPGGIACAQLARDLLTGLAGLVHPHGTVDSAGTLLRPRAARDGLGAGRTRFRRRGR
jgi:hypothetical protein